MGYRPWGHRELVVTELNNSAVLEAPESLLPFPHPHRSLLTEEPALQRETTENYIRDVLHTSEMDPSHSAQKDGQS